MLYLKPLWAYQGATTKHVANKLNKKLIKFSNGYYKTGLLAMWPEALSEYVTNEFNTIAYTKFHLNLNEGIQASRKRALNFFKISTYQILEANIADTHILKPPHGLATSDKTDNPYYRTYFHFIGRWQQLKIYIRAYLRYWRLRLG